jgi:hypothetical protein
VPHAPEVVALVLELHHGRDQRLLRQAGEVRVFHRVAETPGEGHLLLRGHRLAAQEDHEMIQERLAHLGHHLVFEVVGHIDAQDLGTKRSRQWTNLDVSIVPHRSSSAVTTPSVRVRRPLEEIYGPAVDSRVGRS